MKLIPNLGDKTNNVLHYRNLQLYLSLTLIQNSYLRDICTTHTQRLKYFFDENHDEHAWCRI